MAARVDLRHPELVRLLRVQCGVLTWAQLVGAGASEGDIARMRRRREIRRVHPGVYVDHTGPLTYEQREWVAVLAAWPAALCGESAIPGRRPQTIAVAVERGRTVSVPDGAALRRTSGLARRVRRGTQPPRIRLEDAVIDLMVQHLAVDDVAAAFGELARTCFGRPDLPRAILGSLAERPRVARRQMIEDLLVDLRDGACSVLERGYLLHVERAHGLSAGSRQVVSRATGRRTDIDVRYDEFGLIVELHGRAFHDSPSAYDADAERALAERAVAGSESLRITYGLVFRTGCRTAAWIATILHRLGWEGTLRRCPRCPPAASAAA